MRLSENEKKRLNATLRALVKKRGGRVSASSVWGISERTLAGYISGESDPKLSFLAAVADAEGLALGDFFAEGIAKVRIPLRDVYASSGPGCDVADEAIIRHLTFDPYFVESWGIPVDRVEAVINRGDSNEPTIRDGALVLIDRSDRTLREKAIFAFRTPDGVRLKRFQRLIDGSARLVSDNQALYAPELISPADLEQLRVVGRAFWTGMEI